MSGKKRRASENTESEGKVTKPWNEVWGLKSSMFNPYGEHQRRSALELISVLLNFDEQNPTDKSFYNLAFQKTLEIFSKSSESSETNLDAVSDSDKKSIFSVLVRYRKSELIESLHIQKLIPAAWYFGEMNRLLSRGEYNTSFFDFIASKLTPEDHISFSDVISVFDELIARGVYELVGSTTPDTREERCVKFKELLDKHPPLGSADLATTGLWRVLNTAIAHEFLPVINVLAGRDQWWKTLDAKWISKKSRESTNKMVQDTYNKNPDQQDTLHKIQKILSAIE